MEKEDPRLDSPQLKTRTRFSRNALDDSKSGVLIVEKVTLNGGLIACFYIGLAEEEIRNLKDICTRRLEEEL